MNPLANLLSAEQVLLDLDASSKKRVFEQAGMLFEARLGLARSTIFDSLFAREKLGSTGLGQGVAIPVPFDSPDGRPVDLLFVLLVPEQATEQHLQILSELAQRFSERTFREKLQAAPDAAAIVALFQG